MRIMPLFDNKTDQTGWKYEAEYRCGFCGRPISRDRFEETAQCAECGRLRYAETRMEFQSILEGVFEDDRCNWWMDI